MDKAARDKVNSALEFKVNRENRRGSVPTRRDSLGNSLDREEALKSTLKEPMELVMSKHKTT